MDEKSEINFMKPSKEKSAFGEFLSDEFCCNGCEKYLKTKDGAFFCYKCDFHKCQSCVKKECHVEHYHSLVPKCDSDHVLRFINTHAHDKLFATDKNEIDTIYFKNGSYLCDMYK